MSALPPSQSILRQEVAQVVLQTTAGGAAGLSLRSAKYQGVHRLRRQEGWRAQFVLGQQAVNLGHFATEDDAARCWNEAALLFGVADQHEPQLNAVEPRLPAGHVEGELHLSSDKAAAAVLAAAEAAGRPQPKVMVVEEASAMCKEGHSQQQQRVAQPPGGDPPHVLKSPTTSYQVVLNGQWQPKLLGIGNLPSRVYEYIDTSSNEHVAIKRMPLSGLEPKAAAMLHARIEAGLTAHYVLNHPHVVKMKDVFVSEDGCLNKVMEFVSGGSLLQHVNGLITKHGGHVPEDKARWLFQQLVMALDYMHAKGVAHGDIKLETCLLQSSANQELPLVKVAGFGLARPSSTSDSCMGTPLYMAPEIFNERLRQVAAADTAATDMQKLPSTAPSTYNVQHADVWSAGVLLYAMLVRKYPFTREEVLKGVEATRTQQLFAELQQSGKDMSPDACDLLQQPLQPHPSQRITMAHLKKHPWVAQDLPAAALQMTEQALPRPPPSADRVSVASLQAVVAAVKQWLQPLADSSGSAGGVAGLSLRSAKYQSVYRLRRQEGWRAQFVLDKQAVNLGHFATEDDAARCWNEAALLFGGPTAQLNAVEPRLPASHVEGELHLSSDKAAAAVLAAAQAAGRPQPKLVVIT